MFTISEREQILHALIERARTGATTTAAAVVGSRARGQSDAWSDIDLALRVVEAVDPSVVAAEWTAFLRAEYAVVDHLDLWSDSALYRVFLLADSLQIDLSFWPAADFASTGEAFDLVFGETDAIPPDRTPDDSRGVVGWAWLYALHTRSALLRGHIWQALQMLEGLRDRIVTLACRRHGLPAHQGRGVDALPGPFLERLAHTVVARPDASNLAQSFSAAVGLLLGEVDHLDPELARRLRRPLIEMTGSAGQVG